MANEVPTGDVSQGQFNPQDPSGVPALPVARPGEAPQSPVQPQPPAAGQPSAPAPARPAAQPPKPVADQHNWFGKILEGMAGQTKVLTTDPKTGQSTYVAQPMTKGAIARGILAGAISGMMAGYEHQYSRDSQGRLRQNLGEATAAGAEAGEAQRQKPSQVAQAIEDQKNARYYSTVKQNQELYSAAMHNTQLQGEIMQKPVDENKGLLTQLNQWQASHPETQIVIQKNGQPLQGVPGDQIVKNPDLVDLMRHGGIIDGTAPVIDENGQPKMMEDGKTPMMQYTYTIIDPNAMFKLNPAMKDEIAKIDPRFKDVSPNATVSARMFLDKITQNMNVNATNETVNRWKQKAAGQAAQAQMPWTEGSIWKYQSDPGDIAKILIRHEGENPALEANHNPGNLKGKVFGATSVDKNGFAIFNNDEEGKAAVISQVRKYERDHPGWTAADLAHTYSPDKSKGGDNPDGTEKGLADMLREGLGIENPFGGDADVKAPEPKIDKVDWAAEVRKDPRLNQIMPLVGKYASLDPDEALDAMRKDQDLHNIDPMLIQRLQNIIGVDETKMRQERAMTAEQQKDQIKAQEQLKKEAQDRLAKKREKEGSYQTLVDAIGQGDMAELDKLISQRTADRPVVFSMLKEQYPGWNMQTAKTKAGVWHEYFVQGKPKDQISSVNTLFKHIGDAVDASEEWRRTNSPLITKSMKWFADNLKSDPTYTKFNASLEPMKDEFYTFLLNNHALTESDKNSAHNLANVSLSPAALMDLAREFGKISAQRIQTTDNQYKTAFEGHGTPNLIQPNTVPAILKLTDGRTGRNDVVDILANANVGGDISGSSKGYGSGGTTLREAAGMQAPAPQGAEGQAKGKDGKMYWTNRKGQNLGLVQ